MLQLSLPRRASAPVKKELHFLLLATLLFGLYSDIICTAFNAAWPSDVRSIQIYDDELMGPTPLEGRLLLH